MSWKAHYSAAKSSGPSLNMGQPVTMIAPENVPTTQLGWKDHFQDMNAATMDIKKHIGTPLAGVMTDNPAEQVAVGGAIANALSK
jgi:hypothetical protein